MVLNDMSESEEQESEEELRIPVVMVLLVLVAYTAIGGLLFQAWEGWRYFDAFYFCFITMATVGNANFRTEIDLSEEKNFRFW